MIEDLFYLTVCIILLSKISEPFLMQMHLH